MYWNIIANYDFDNILFIMLSCFCFRDSLRFEGWTCELFGGWSCCSLFWGNVGLGELLFPQCHWSLQRHRESFEQDRTDNAKDLNNTCSVLVKNNVENFYRSDE